MFILLLILIFFLLLVLGFSYYAYRIAFYSPQKAKAISADTLPPSLSYDNLLPGIQKSIDNMLHYSYEPVTITSSDGKKLFARFYHTADNAPLHILFHGYKSTPFIDCSGGTYLAKEMGHNALVIDQRSHGLSEGNAITFGIMERHDCLSWIRYACERFGPETPIILSGLSMGAATVLMAADLDLPINVKGIMADCPYSSPKDIILKVSKEMHFPPKLSYPFIKLGAFLFAHFNLDETSAFAAVQKTQVPILLIHGESDRFVPCDMSRKIHQACASPITFLTVPDAGHGKSYLVSPKQYENTVIKFVTDILQ